MRLALAQINTNGDVASNLAKVRDFASSAASKNADVVIFPEASMSAFGTDLARAADEHSDGWRKALAALAAEFGISVVAGEFESAAARVRNLLVAYQPDGTRAEYAKIHLYDAFGYKESDSVEPGNNPATFTVNGTTVGMAICYDIRFPKLFAELSRAGAPLTIVSASWGAGPGKVAQWELLARARALDSNAFVVAVGQADPSASKVQVPEGAPTGVGHSLAVNPFGEVIASLGEAEELAIVDIDEGEAAKAAAAIPVLENARLGY